MMLCLPAPSLFLSQNVYSPFLGYANPSSATAVVPVGIDTIDSRRAAEGQSGRPAIRKSERYCYFRRTKKSLENGSVGVEWVRTIVD